jgi:phosphoribosylglycinamide formyltransferase-1
MNIAFLASHNGTSAQAITKACQSAIIKARPVLLISNNASSRALAWAGEAGLITAVVNDQNSSNTDAAISDLLNSHKIDWTLCSGYMKLIGPRTIEAVQGKILNVHPALLPRYGGKSMFGRKVHEAVFKNKDIETGITIHLVDGEYDHGRIVAQKKLSIPPGLDPAGIEDLVKKAEPNFYLETLKNIILETSL